MSLNIKPFGPLEHPEPSNAIEQESQRIKVAAADQNGNMIDNRKKEERMGKKFLKKVASILERLNIIK